MAKGYGKIIGITVSITWIMTIALLFFINAMRVILGDWFNTHAVAIAIISGVILLVGIITGTISLKALMGGNK